MTKLEQAQSRVAVVVWLIWFGPPVPMRAGAEETKLFFSFSVMKQR
jgi:hypothetical protein